MYTYEKKDTATVYYITVGGFFSPKRKKYHEPQHNPYGHVVDPNNFKRYTALQTTSGQIVLWKDVNKKTIQVKIEYCNIEAVENKYDTDGGW